MKIYTKTGDDGTTGLIGGGRVRKSHARLDAYGTVDELNGLLGVAAVVADAPVADPLRRVMDELFVVGSHLATPAGKRAAAHLPALGESMSLRLEAEMDAADATLPPLKQFVLPGGCELAARLHVARTVCRRAERRLVDLPAEDVEPPLLTYVNRLSDWLFVQARAANQRAGVADVPWRKG
jgi:cob(I)alamin adenosyltransferase